VRKEIAGADPTLPAPAAYRTGLYRPELSEATYATMLDHAERLLTRGESVVLDASWSQPQHRSRATALAEATHADLIELHCTAPASLTSARLRARAGTGDPSDADPAIAAVMMADFAAWPSATPIDTVMAPDRCVAAALAAVAGTAGEPTDAGT
jgi:hypothetical protein